MNAFKDQTFIIASGTKLTYEDGLVLVLKEDLLLNGRLHLESNTYYSNFLIAGLPQKMAVVFSNEKIKEEVKDAVRNIYNLLILAAQKSDMITRDTKALKEFFNSFVINPHLFSSNWEAFV